MTTTNAPKDEAVRAARAAEPRLLDRAVSGGRTMALDRFVESPSRRSRTDCVPHEAILQALHDERGLLARKRRLKTITASEVAQLAELEAYIDELEVKNDENATASVWAKLDEIAGRVIAIGSGIERKR